jgi:hypothetical protein
MKREERVRRMVSAIEGGITRLNEKLLRARSLLSGLMFNLRVGDDVVFWQGENRREGQVVGFGMLHGVPYMTVKTFTNHAVKAMFINAFITTPYKKIAVRRGPRRIRLNTKIAERLERLRPPV